MNLLHILVTFLLYPCVIKSEIIEFKSVSNVSISHYNFINDVSADSSDVKKEKSIDAGYEISVDGIFTHNDTATVGNRKLFKRSAAKRISEIKCEQYSRIVRRIAYSTYMSTSNWAIKYSVAACAKMKFIYGGVPAKKNEFPHMAAVGWSTAKGGYNYSCGGSLISQTFVLTAGHCTYDPRALNPHPEVVFIGNNFLDPNNVPVNSIYHVEIKSIHKHPEYNPPKRYNDIALLKLKRRLDITLERRPACLWERSDFNLHALAIATGWGRTETADTTTDLQTVMLRLLSNDVCDPLLVKIRNRNWSGFSATQLCAGDLRGGKDTCQGDSGAPLQVTEDGCTYYVMGVTSFGHRCAEPDRPAIYTRVSKYLDWIEGIVWPGK